MNSSTKILVWVGVSVLIIGSIFIFIKLAKNSSPGPVSSGEVKLSQPLTDADWTTGNKNAKAVLVEYGDFQCQACNTFYPIIHSLLQSKGSQILFAYRQFPLRSIHINADLTARASEAAGKQGKFWQMYDLLFQKHDEWADNLKAADLVNGYAQFLGLDMSKFGSDLNSQIVKDKVQGDISSGNASGVTGTPTFFLNGVQMKFTTYNQFNTMVDDAINAK